MFDIVLAYVEVSPLSR